MAVLTIAGIAIFTGKGDGTFSSTPYLVSQSGGVAIGTLASGDFNGDGKIDFAVRDADRSGEPIRLYLGQGDGTFHFSPLNPPLPTMPSSYSSVVGFLLAGEFNGDGRTDLVLINSADGTFTVLAGKTPAGTGSATLTLRSPANPITFGRTGILTAVISPATASGTVTFYDGQTILGESSL